MKLFDAWRWSVLLAVLLTPAMLLAQPRAASGPPPVSAAASVPPSAAVSAAPSLVLRPASAPASTSLLVVGAGGGDCGPDECCPPTMAQKLFIGVCGLALVLIFFFLFIRVMSSQAIKQGTSVLQARHRGIALALFLSTAGLAGLFYFVTGCWPPQATLWVAFMGGVWLLHTIYALAVLRGK